MKDSDSDNVSGHTASSAEIGLLSDINIWDVLILAEEWQVEDDLEWLGVSGENNKVSASSVQGFGSLVGSLLQKLEVLGLIQKIKNLLLHVVVSLWPSSRFFNGSFLYSTYYNQSSIILQYCLSEGITFNKTPGHSSKKSLNLPSFVVFL